MPNGQDLVKLSLTRLGEKYEHKVVPKDDPNYHGPWDCAEFVSWVVYQTTHKLFGCANNHGNPHTQDAYTGYWVNDVNKELFIETDFKTALATPGVILLREPPGPGKMGHIVISDGEGKGVQAKGKLWGVVNEKLSGGWDHYLMIPGVKYSTSDVSVSVPDKPKFLTLTNPVTHGEIVKKIQEILREKGYYPYEIDGKYEQPTIAAVWAFQNQNGLVPDGIVGPKTAKKLGISW